MPDRSADDAVAGGIVALLVVAGIWALVIHQDRTSLRDGSRRRLVAFDTDVQVPVEVTVPRTARTARRWMERFTPTDDG